MMISRHLGTLSCPYCQESQLQDQEDSIDCQGCQRTYPVYFGIPDFRIVSPDHCGYASLEEDREAAGHLYKYSRDHSYRETVEMWVDSFAVPATREMHLQFRLSNPAKAEALKETLRGCVEGLGLDIGCGSGGGALGLLQMCPEVISIDVQLSELVCARKMMEELGLGDRCLFLAASAESLPLRSNSIALASALDVFEHVFDQSRFIREGYRVLSSEGTFFFHTPSRYKWMETHYMLPGLGYLPRPLQKLYVGVVRKDKAYPIYLVSLGKLTSMLHSILPKRSWAIKTAPVINQQPRRAGWKGRLLRLIPGWRRFVRLANLLAGPFTSFQVFIRK